MKESNSLGDRIFTIGAYVYLIVMTLFCLFPFWIMVAASFTDDMVLRQDGYLPWAREWSLEAYRWVFKGNEIRIGYMVTLFVTIFVILFLISAVTASIVALALSVMSATLLGGLLTR